MDRIVENYPTIIQIHAFYLDREKNIITFDMVVSFDDKNPNETKEKIINELSKKYPDYQYNVIIDNDFSD